MSRQAGEGLLQRNRVLEIHGIGRIPAEGIEVQLARERMTGNPLAGSI